MRGRSMSVRALLIIALLCAPRHAAGLTLCTSAAVHRRAAAAAQRTRPLLAHEGAPITGARANDDNASPPRKDNLLEVTRTVREISIFGASLYDAILIVLSGPLVRQAEVQDRITHDRTTQATAGLQVWCAGRPLQLLRSSANVRADAAAVVATAAPRPPAGGDDGGGDDEGESVAVERNRDDSDAEMTAMDYVTFVGYIGGFVAFFYAIAALIGAGTGGQ